MRLPCIVAVALLAVALASPVPLRADDAAARAAFQEGKDRFTAGEYVLAARAFRRANELSPNWKLQYNIGQSEVAAKRYGLALQAFEQYLAEGGDEISGARQDEVIAEIKRLREMVGSVKVTGPDGCDVLVDDEQRGTTPLTGEMLVSAGVEHLLVARRGAEVVLERRFVVRGGKSIEIPLEGTGAPVAVALPPDPAPPEEGADATPGPADAGEPGPEPAPRSTLRTAGWIALGVGAAALVGGAITGGLAVAENRELEDDCPEGTCPEGYDLGAEQRRDRYALATDILIPTGAVVAAAGAALLIVDAVKRNRADETALAGIRPAVGPRPGGAAIVLEGSF